MLSNLYHFVVTVEEGTFEAASIRLKLSRAQLDAEFQELSAIFNVRLFVDNSPKLTDAGRVLFSSATKVRTLIDEFVDTAVALRRSEAGMAVDGSP